ncbi:hypothetical protein C8R30_10477 [Nitrosomonas nitrosa]|jgi:hypothetical protein|uniref:Uncharacterized protein n=1 Tax=Nitrosomonas nitrosa TaxID=52442 RepID=A0A1I4PSU9_9PROT|nr:hypothetical protein C8R30_10477 [Nitrosomonas nitrosa]SFM30824.1 hypothetical protein SAMN05421880_11269 [Nitrosomonas nitrosa]
MLLSYGKVRLRVTVNNFESISYHFLWYLRFIGLLGLIQPCFQSHGIEFDIDAQ